MPDINGTARRLWAKITRRARSAQAAVDAAFLSRSVTVALWTITLFVIAADLVAFAGSYLGLYQWAVNHGLAGWRAAVFPVMVDTFVAVGELALFVSAAKGWRGWSRVWPWIVTLTGLAASVAGNVGHAWTADWWTRATWAIPPVAAFGALAVALGVLKGIARERSAKPETVADLGGGMPATSFGFRTPEGETARVISGPLTFSSSPAGVGTVVRMKPPNGAGSFGEANAREAAAREGIRRIRESGREPSQREVAARWLGGDPDSGPAWSGGNKRLAKRLLEEG